jgi:L-ornithine N5-oxygenase
MSVIVHDILGVGFGPANLALAIALEESGFQGSVRFLEARDEFAWQPGMMLRGSDIQHNPLRDLITPVNPRSTYGFVSYIHQSGRFFDYLNLGAAFPLRREFAAYVDWAASHFLNRVIFGANVEAVGIVPHPVHGRVVEIVCVNGTRSLARSVVLGPGRTLNIPDVFQPSLGDRVFHLVDYLPRIEALKSPLRILVVGASQSAVEIMLDLDSRFPGAQLLGITRGFGYRLKDTSPWTSEVYFPGFTDYFYQASWPSRRALSSELRSTNYSAADADVLNQLYLRRYESRLEGAPDHIQLAANAEITQCEAESEGVSVTYRDRHSGLAQTIVADAVVLATGFLDFGTGNQREIMHRLLTGLTAHYDLHPQHGFEVARDYSLVGANAPPVFLNGLCESTHGFGDAGSFSLLSLRAHEISRAVQERLGTLSCSSVRPHEPRVDTALRTDLALV